MRRLVLVLVAVLAVPALAVAADSDPKRKINQADERRAAAVVLKRADLSAGWKKTTSPSTDDDDLVCSYYDPKGSDLTLTGDAEAEFEQAGGFPSVYSYADVYATPKDAAAAWTRTVKVAAARCFADVFKKESASDPSTKVTGVRYGSIAFPKVAPRTAAFRVALTVAVTQNGETQTIPLALHIVVVGRGRAEAGLMTFAPSPGVAAPELRAFANLMSDRMKAAGF